MFFLVSKKKLVLLHLLNNDYMNRSVIKKVYTYVLIISVFSTVLNISCVKKSKATDNDVAFDTIQTDKSESINYKKSKLNCNLHIAFTFPVDYPKATMLSDLQKVFIEKVFPPQYSDFSPQEALEKFSAKYISDFKAIKAEDFFEEDYILEDENDFMYELNLENEIRYNRNNLISFVVKNINYEGGARGSTSIYGYVLDLNTGKFLTEEDFAGKNYKKNLAPVIAKKIATAKGLNNVSQLESIGYIAIKDIVPNENFILDDKGITYYFNENEIADDFVGITEVFIPYEELKAYITNDNQISSITGGL